MAKQQGINHITILGNIQKQPAQGGGALSVLLDCVERFKDTSGEWGDRVVAVPVVIFGKRGDSLASHLKIGDRILVEGAFDVRGPKGFVRASNVVLCGGKRPQNSPSAGQPLGGDDEIPF
jgi:Single-strand binding protein family